jgi:hypothetical protein
MDPEEPDEYDRCDEAPNEGSFAFDVDRNEEGIYSTTELGDTGQTWTVQVRDKGGSCYATFSHDLGGGAVLSLTPGEDGPDGPFEGRGNYELREE